MLGLVGGQLVIIVAGLIVNDISLEGGMSLSLSFGISIVAVTINFGTLGYGGALRIQDFTLLTVVKINMRVHHETK